MQNQADVVNTTKLAEAINLILEAKENDNLEDANNVLANSTINDWRGYALQAIQLQTDRNPSLEEFNNTYKDKMPIIIKGNKKEYGTFPIWIYARGYNGEPYMQELSWIYRQKLCKNIDFTTNLSFISNPPTELHNALITDRKHNFDDVITPIISDLEKNSKLLTYITTHKLNISSDSLNHIANKWLITYDQYTHKLEQINVDVVWCLLHNMHQVEIKFAEENKFVYLLNNKQDALITQNDGKDIIAYLLDPNVDQKMKAKLFMIIKDNPKFDLVKLLPMHNPDFSPSNKTAAEMVLIQAILHSNTQASKNADFISNLIDPDNNEDYFEKLFEQSSFLIIDQLVGMALSEELKRGIFSESIINSNNKDYVEFKIMQTLAEALHDDTIDKSTRQAIFASMFSLLPTPVNTDRFSAKTGELKRINYTEVHENILLYIIQNWQEHPELLEKELLYLSRLGDINCYNEEKLASDIPMELLTDKLASLRSTSASLTNLYRILIKIKMLYSSKQEKQALLPFMYKDDLDTLSKMLFIENEEEHTKKDHAKQNSSRIIYNNDKYISDQAMRVDASCAKGDPLTLDNPEKTPIGYNIHIPSGEVKGVFVSVYGGFQKKDKDKRVNHPVGLPDFEQELLNNGIAVVKLNLVTLLELDKFQGEMPEKLHTKIMDSIKQFYHVLSTRPEDLHPDLVKLKDLKKVLYGASFGGRTAVKFAETHPGTFDRYISHDGWISLEMSTKSDLPMVIQGRVYKEYLNTISDLNKLEEPVLVIQNLDDNNVNSKVAFDWVNAAIQVGKAELVRLHTFNAGNPIPAKDAEGKRELHNKGHFQPTDQATFDHYCRVMQEFIVNGPSHLPVFSEWQAYIQDKLANKFYTSGILQEKFIAEAMRIYKKSEQEDKDKPTNQSTWQKTYEPLYTAMWFVDDIKKDNNKIITEINRLKGNNLLTDEVIKKAMQQHMTIYLQYVREAHGYNLPIAETRKALLNNPQMIQNFREILDNISSGNPDYQTFILTSLYTANPELLTDLSKTPEYEASLATARTEFSNVIGKEKNMISRVWQQAAKNIISKEQDNYKKFLADMDKLLLSPEPLGIYSADIYKKLLRNIRLSLNENVGKESYWSNIGHLAIIKQKYAELISKYEALYTESQQGGNKFNTLHLTAAKLALAILESLKDPNVDLNVVKDEAVNMFLQFQYKDNKDARERDREKVSGFIEAIFTEFKENLLEKKGNKPKPKV